jgi:hypothetical protein
MMEADAQGTDEKLSDVISNVFHQLTFRLINDANTNANNWMVLHRSGFVPTELDLPEPIVIPSAAVNTLGTVCAGGISLCVNAGSTFTVDTSGKAIALSYHETLTTPASSSAPCNAGDFTDDANFHYVCTAPNTWKRVALSAF